ncbi:MAG: tetratricopeptide repeat protein [Muribaculaceae bacterium]|nr:tetratricopeptide repeat protein [Muribaculaceae bacterium]
MRKFLLSIIIGMLITVPVAANEVEEDYLDMAAGYCVKGEYALAMDYLDKILMINSANTRVMNLKKGLTHIMNNDMQSYVAGVNPQVKQAHEYKRAGSDQGELQSLKNAAAQANSYLAYYYLGNFYRDRQDYLHALDSYNAALSAKPDFVQAYLASGITLFEAGKYESALNPLDKYITFVPDDDLAYAVKSRAEFQLGMMVEAKADNDKAISLNDCSQYQFDRAKLLYKAGEYNAAKNLFQALLSDIQNSKIYEYLGYCDFALGDYVNSLMNIDKAIILSDGDEYLENRYNEIKEMLENSNAQTEED